MFKIIFLPALVITFFLLGGYAQAADETYIGVVHDGEFYFMSPSLNLDIPTQLTSIGMQESVPPETGELDLDCFEGMAIMIEGHDGGGWIYSAVIIDEAGPILTAMVWEVFASTDFLTLPEEEESESYNPDQFLGYVNEGTFYLLPAEYYLDFPVRLSAMPMYAAALPESSEFCLDEWEGQVVMVEGYDGGGWIYSAEIIDQAGPILSALVMQVFNMEET